MEFVTTPARSFDTLPPNYRGHATTDSKIEAGHFAITFARDQGYEPLAASVTGSQIRGLDNAASDTDTLVIISNKIPKPREILTIPQRDNTSVTIIGLSYFLSKLDTSFVYAEMQLSPFLVARPSIHTLFNSYYPNPYTLHHHAQGFLRSILERTKGEKKFRQQIPVRHFLDTGDFLYQSDAHETVLEESRLGIFKEPQ